MRDYPKLVCPPPGPKARAIIERDARTMSQNHRKDYPLVVDHAKGPVVVDADGNRYLDFAAGIAVASTGHCHPDVVAAVQRQAARLLHLCATDFYNEDVVTLAEGLARRAPGPGPWRVFFANSGAEVVEAAIKLARLRTGRPKVVAFYGAFHGRTFGALSLTASKPVSVAATRRCCRRCCTRTTRTATGARSTATPTPARWNVWTSSRRRCSQPRPTPA